MTLSFALMAVVVIVAVYLVIWGKVSSVARHCAIVLAVAALGVALLGDIQALSRPKPVGLEFFASAPEAEVVGARVIEGVGIYVLLQLPDQPEPRYYVLPWDRKTAEQLQEAMREAEENRNAVQMRLPFEPSLDDREPKFYTMPQPAMPPKDALEPPTVYEQEGV